MKCPKCQKRIYIFSNKKFKNIKLKYCPECAVVYPAHNKTLDFSDDKRN